MRNVNTYTISELSNGNNSIIIEQNGISIGLELDDEGVRLYQYFPTEIISRGLDHLIRRKDYARPDSRFKEKPTLGLRPRFLHDEERLDKVVNAIKRYSDVGYQIPSEWIEEYNELVQKKQ